MIDARIAMGVKSPEIESPVNALAGVLGVQRSRQQNMLGQMQIEETQRGQAGENMLAQLLAGGKSGDEVSTGLAAGGYGNQALAYTKNQAELGKTQAAAEKDRIAANIQKLALGAQILGGAQDQPGYERARQSAQSNGADVSGWPAQYDPAFIAQKQREGQTIAQQLSEKWKAMEYTTPTANAMLGANTAAAGREASQRNAEMTDRRARDFNDTRVEENRIKREAKDDTATLTRNSQIASFDTMLGTLDRLGKHPGLERSVGVMGAMPTMPGSDSANFQAELNTFQSQAFLPMIAQLKGMGALSDAEGKKLTAAVGALDPKMGEQAFRDSVGRITTDMQAARQRMAGGASNQPAPAAPVAGQMISVKTAADYASVPSGATYTTPDGKVRRKP